MAYSSQDVGIRNAYALDAERALADLVKEGLIEKVGASSATAYVWIQK